MMKTVTFTLVLALLSVDVTNGSTRAMDGVVREKFEEDSMKINELRVGRLLHDAVSDYNMEMSMIALLL